MPAPIAVDMEQVRMLVLSVGPREAARRLGLKEDTVCQWSARRGWLAHITDPRPVALPASMVSESNVIKPPADALRDIIAEDGQATRVAGMRYARRVTEAAARVAESDPVAALEMAKNVKSGLQSAAIAGSWQQAGVDGATTVINIALLGHSQSGDAPVTVDLT